jgi:hypothetical protein
MGYQLALLAAFADLGRDLPFDYYRSSAWSSASASTR